MWPIKLPPPQAWVASDAVFSVAEIDRIVMAGGAPQDKATVGANNATDLAYRDSNIRWLPPSPETQWLYEIIEDAFYQVNKHFHLDLELINDLQFTEYDAAYTGKFGAHIDEAYGYHKDHRRILSMSVQLSEPDEYDGGELLLYPASLSPVTTPKRRGLASFFRSHVIHEVTPVTRGVRKSLVAWACGPKGKY